MIGRAWRALEWLDEGRSLAAATLVEVDGSAPMDPGATMLVDGDGTIDGSVTGGCVEAALAETSGEVLAGTPARVVTHGITDDEALDVGMMCGGTVRLFVHAIGDRDVPNLQAVSGAAASGQDVVLATLLDGPEPGRTLALTNGRALGSLCVTPALDEKVTRDLHLASQVGYTGITRYEVGGRLGSDVEVFIESMLAPAAMMIIGATDHSAAVAALAPALGYRPVLCDPRSAFVSSGRFRGLAETVTDWPDRFIEGRSVTERDVILVFTHDPKLDEAALLAALRTDAGYIGALGSRRAQADRAERLREAGASDGDMARVIGPCGLDIGARSPEETAISVLADVIARRAGRDGGRLDESSSSIRGSDPALVGRR